MSRATTFTAQPARPSLTPLYLMGAGLAAVVAIVVPGVRAEPLLFGIVAGSYVPALSSLAWTIAPVVALQLTISSYVPGTSVSLRLATAVFSLVLAAPAMLHGTQVSDQRFRRVLLPSVAFILVVLGMNLLHSDTDYTFKYFRYQLTQLIPLMLIALTLQHRRDLKALAILALLVGLLTAGAAVLQNYSPYSPLYVVESPAKILKFYGGRVLGLSRTPVLLASQLLFVLMPLLGVLACGAWRIEARRLLLLAAAGVLIAAVYFSETRSALLGVAVGLLVIGLYVGGRRRAALAALVAMAGIAYLVLRGSGVVEQRYYKGPQDDRSASSHLVFWQVGLAMALDNSVVGIGHEQFDALFGDYASDVEVSPGQNLPKSGASDGGADLSGLRQKGAANPKAGDTKETKTHNDFLNVWISWGFLAIVSYLAMFGGVLVNCAMAVKSPDPLIRGLAAGCAGGLVAYGVHSAFHNALDSTAFLWMYAGLSVALASLAAETTQSNRVQRLLALRAPVRRAMLRQRFVPGMAFPTE